MQVSKAVLIFEIEKAFKYVLFENGIGLSEADAIDSYSDLKFRNNCKKMMRNLIGKQFRYRP